MTLAKPLPQLGPYSGVIVTRLATLADSDALANFELELLHPGYSAAYQADDLRLMLRSTGVVGVVMESRSGIIWAYLLLETSGNGNDVDILHVVVRQQVSRQGLGTHLLRIARCHLGSSVKKLRTICPERAVGLQQFLAAHGFRADGLAGRSVIEMGVSGQVFDGAQVIREILHGDGKVVNK